MYQMIIGLILSCSLLLNTTILSGELSAAPAVNVPVLSIDGAIGPAVSDYLIREIDKANQFKQAPIIIITIDTPGGLSASLRDINQRILSSDIPIACLVYPKGARAASAGTYILYACHVASMATATTLGAATPVMISGAMSGQKKPKQEGDKPTAMENKVLNDAIAYIRSLAQLRQRNEEWAELAVTEAATLTATEALAINVIDLIADSPQQLLRALNDSTLKINQHNKLSDLSNAILDFREPDWRSQFIATITNPNIAYILMLIGIYGLLLEFYSPGIGVAGVTGAISLFIALYAFQMLPLNYAGLGLLLLGITFLIVESMMPSFGVLGIGGLVAFVIGSIFLFDSEQSQFQVSLRLISAITIMSALFIIYVMGALWRLRKHKVVSGIEEIIGAEVKVENSFTGQGYVLFNGERWAAHSAVPLTAGEVVIVKAIDGLTLIIFNNNRRLP
ncbi:MAG: nodulation protein NfeD [Psychrobium sp.]|nr:nodulation protein NfeD [Psychrobium sp.]